MDAQPSRNILVKYKESPHYRKVGATGVYGGVTPTGHILCHFFIDFSDIPTELEHVLQEGNLIPQVPSEGRPTVIREFQVGVLLTPDIARSIGEWLIERSNMVLQRGNQ